MGEFEMGQSTGLTADDLAEELLDRADGSYEGASAALTEFARGVQERLSELSKARHLVAELAVTDERLAEFGKRVAVDLGVLERWVGDTIERLVAGHAHEVFGGGDPRYLHNHKKWEAFKRLNEL